MKADDIIHWKLIGQSAERRGVLKETRHSEVKYISSYGKILFNADGVGVGSMVSSRVARAIPLKCRGKLTVQIQLEDSSLLAW